jgi:hypothetical protein
MSIILFNLIFWTGLSGFYWFVYKIEDWHPNYYKVAIWFFRFFGIFVIILNSWLLLK